MRKKILAVIFTLCLAVVAMTVMAFADIASGTGWVLADDGTLTISSDAGMSDWTDSYRDTYGSSVESVVIESGVTTISDYAFYFCDIITSVTIPNTVTIIGDGAFYFCYSLTSIDIPDSVTSIGVYAFNSTGLTSVEIPDSVTIIGAAAFRHCEALTSVTISKSVTSIGNSAFALCYNLATVTIESCATTIADNAFNNTPALTNDNIIINHTTEIQNAKDATCGEDGYTGDEVCTVCGETITAGETIPATGHNYVDHVCTGCGELDCIAFGTDWVLEFDGTLTISSDAGMDNWVYMDNRYVYGSYVESVVIESGVTYISNQAFNTCTNLTSVTIPNSVTSIGNVSFAGSGLTSVTIPSSVTNIGSGAFLSCYYLESVVFEDGINLLAIGDTVFNYCINLTSITIPDSVTSIGDAAFQACIKLTSITIPSSVQTIGAYVFYNCTGLETVTIENCTTTIGTDAFYNTPALANDNIIINHTTEIQNAKDATCGEDGYTGDEVCTVCGETITTGTVIAATGDHTYDSGTVTQEATCTEAGVMTYACTVCGDTYTEAIAATGHSMAHYEAVDAKCTTEGNIEYWYCTTCEKYFSDEDGNTEISLSDTIISATGNHTTEIQNAKEATCTEDGYTGDEVCTVCGETITAGEVIPATGHTLTHYEAVEATCTTDGNIEYWYCSVCGKYFSDEDCTTEITLEDTVIEATGDHTYKAIVTDPTCTEKGYTTYICTECGDNYRSDYTDPAGHTAGTPVKENYVPVTATKDGYYELATYCTICGEEISRSYTTIAAYGTNVRETIDWTAVLNAYANKTTTTVTIEEITITEPVEPGDTETEVDSGDEVTPEPTAEEPETNPTTGMVMAMMPVAMAMAVAVVNKKR